MSNQQFSNPPHRPAPPSQGPSPPKQQQPSSQHTYTHQPEVVVTTQTYTTTQEANVTFVTQRIVWYEGWNFYVGMIIWSAFSILCCLPLGVAAFLVAIWAYSEFSRGNLPKAIGLSKLTSALAITAIVFGILISIFWFIIYYSV